MTNTHRRECDVRVGLSATVRPAAHLPSAFATERVSRQFCVGMCRVRSGSPLCGRAPGYVSSPRGGPLEGATCQVQAELWDERPGVRLRGWGLCALQMLPGCAPWSLSHVGEGLPRARSGRRASVRTVTGRVAGEKVGLQSTEQSVPDPAPPGTWNKPCPPPGWEAGPAGGPPATQMPLPALGLALFERFCLFNNTLHLLNNDEIFLPNRRIFADPGPLPERTRVAELSPPGSS